MKTTRTESLYNISGEISDYELAQRAMKLCEILEGELFASSKWNRTAEKEPSKEGLYLAFHRGWTRILFWNDRLKSWDDEYADDFFCNKLDVTHWQYLPAKPQED